MSEMQIYQSVGGLTASDSRRTARALSKHAARGVLNVNRVDLVADLGLAKVDAATAVTGQGMGAVARVGQARRQYELLGPETAGYLALLADDHALGMVEIASDVRRDLRRI